jgi:hypothetical protein
MTKSIGVSTMVPIPTIPAPSPQMVIGDPLLGSVFGLLTVVDVAESRGGRSHMTCLCECGTIRAFRRSKLVCGEIKSCGCQAGGTVGPRKKSYPGEWSTDELSKLRKLAREGISDKMISEVIVGRTPRAVESMRRDLGITKPKPQREAPKQAPERSCQICKKRFKKKSEEKLGNFVTRVTCSPECALEQQRRRHMASDASLALRSGWPAIDLNFVWPAEQRFVDSDVAIRSNLGHMKMLPESRVSMTGNAASMMVNHEGGSTGRRVGR